MKFLKILATPFIKLWGWIRDTAWVQPLLIVGCIFAVIFSIPYISKGIQNLSKSEEDTMKFYNNNRLSMSGAYKDNSDAGKFLYAYSNAQNAWEDYNNSKNLEDSKKTLSEFSDKYGDKFFFILAKSSCDACENISTGLEYLKNNQSKYDVKGVKLHTIVVDQDLSKNDEDDNYKTDSAFKMIYDNYSGAFDNFYDAGRNGSYYTSNVSDYSSYVDNLETLHGKVEDIKVPLVIMVDLSKDDNGEYMMKGYDYIATQVFFEITGDTKYDRASSFADCWKYYGKTFGKSVTE